MATKRVACLGDAGSASGHSGTITDAGQTSVRAGGVLVANAAGKFTCGLHGVVGLVPATVHSFAGGVLIITETAQSSCGCVIHPPDRQVYVE